MATIGHVPVYGRILETSYNKQDRHEQYCSTGSRLKELNTLVAKTYVPALRVVMKTAHKYGTRWQPQLSSTLTAPQYACLISTLAAIADCLALLGEQVPLP